jgi:lipopolysaccharide/colanic/teichoic acid biosynthesis glycosyltransferase
MYTLPYIHGRRPPSLSRAEGNGMEGGARRRTASSWTSIRPLIIRGFSIFNLITTLSPERNKARTMFGSTTAPPSHEHPFQSQIALSTLSVMESRSGGRSVARGLKRGLDLALGTVFLVCAMPLAAVISISIKLSSPGPILFCQERIGQRGRPFMMYKFRTMQHGADTEIHREYFQRYMRGVPASTEVRKVFKLRNDPRITPMGRWLRRLALDEIPQLVNVIKGEMSLVGPRPPLAYEVEQYTERHFMRLSVKPGITGLWQIRGRDVVDFESMVELDLEYIERQSLRLDLWILLATIPTLVWSCVKR